MKLQTGGLARQAAVAGTAQPRASFDSWAAYYDLITGDRSAMAGFYCSLIGAATSGILELACGTGAITVALAQRLVEGAVRPKPSRVVGVDESGEMLRIARAKDARLDWVLGDMRAPPVSGVFDLVLCCFNTVQSLLTEHDLIGFFGRVHSLVAPGGVLAFDIVQPDVPYLRRMRHEHVAHAVIDESGRPLEHRRRYTYDPRSRLLAIDHRVVVGGSEPAVPLAQLHQQYRQYASAEVAGAVEAAGFMVRQLYGDFDGSPLSPVSPKQIFVCTADGQGHDPSPSLALPR